jgi:tRNA uridine 5-carboxymethylaminomethyl modification enzyme
LTPRGIDIGCVGVARAEMFHVKHLAFLDAKQRLTELTLTPAKAAALGWNVNQDGKVRTAMDYLAYKDIGFEDLVISWPELENVSRETSTQLSIEAQYAGYLARQREDVEALRRDEDLVLPTDIDYGSIGGLKMEVRQKLEMVRPETLGQAGRIEGVTPGALTALLGHVKRRKRTG